MTNTRHGGYHPRADSAPWIYHPKALRDHIACIVALAPAAIAGSKHCQTSVRSAKGFVRILRAFVNILQDGHKTAADGTLARGPLDAGYEARLNAEVPRAILRAIRKR